jgi:hypothetical protein
MVLNVGYEVSLDFIQECKGILEKAEEVNGMKSHTTNDRTARIILSGRYISIRKGAENSLAFPISYLQHNQNIFSWVG